MRRDFQETPVPADVPSLWARLVRFARSVPETVLITSLPDGSPITVDTTGTLLPHGVRGRIPRSARAWPVGTTASTAVITTGAIDGRYVRLYASAEVTVHVEVLI
jgi:hypothetical protein